MKANNIFLHNVFISAIILLTACNEVKHTAKGGKRSLNVDTATNKNVYYLDKNINAETIYFKANGTEPFWGLEMTVERVIFTSIAQGFETIKAPLTEAIWAMDTNVKMYRLVTEHGEMKIQIAQMTCTDSMSGKENKYQVTVELNRDIDKDFKTFKGCGNYITDYRLHDVWTLEELNGQPINVRQYGKDRPHIEINSTQNSFTGVTGNHAINGKIFFEIGLLRFTDIVVLQNVNASENGFIKNLQSATSYTIENNRLLLFNPSGQLLQFKKTD